MISNLVSSARVTLPKTILKSIVTIENKPWVGLLVAFGYLMISAICYIWQDIAIVPYNKINWALGMAGSYYIAVMLVAVFCPFIVPRDTSKSVRIILAAILLIVQAFAIVTYRSAFNIYFEAYPKLWVDGVVFGGSLLIHILYHIRRA